MSMQYSDNEGCEGFCVVKWKMQCNVLKDTIWFKNSSEYTVLYIVIYIIMNIQYVSGGGIGLQNIQKWGE